MIRQGRLDPAAQILETAHHRPHIVIEGGPLALRLFDLQFGFEHRLVSRPGFDHAASQCPLLVGIGGGIEGLHQICRVRAQLVQRCKGLRPAIRSGGHQHGTLPGAEPRHGVLQLRQLQGVRQPLPAQLLGFGIHLAEPHVGEKTESQGRQQYHCESPDDLHHHGVIVQALHGIPSLARVAILWNAQTYYSVAVTYNAA